MNLLLKYTFLYDFIVNFFVCIFDSFYNKAIEVTLGDEFTNSGLLKIFRKILLGF